MMSLPVYSFDPLIVPTDIILLFGWFEYCPFHEIHAGGKDRFRGFMKILNLFQILEMEL